MQDSILTELLADRQGRLFPEDCLDDPLSYIDACSELLKSSLIRVNMGATPVVIRMHRLVQDISYAEMNTQTKEKVFALISTALFEAWPFTENSRDHQDGF